MGLYHIDVKKNGDLDYNPYWTFVGIMLKKVILNVYEIFEMLYLNSIMVAHIESMHIIYRIASLVPWQSHYCHRPSASEATMRNMGKKNHLGAVSIRKTVLPGMAIPMLKIRRPNGRLIFNMEIAIRR